MSEILAPAGDKKSVLAAINAGADAVYLGLKEYSARSSAENFDIDNFKNTAKYCHAFGVKVYVAMNTLVKDGELENFIATAVNAWNNGADAIILSDIFIGKFLKERCPEIVLHLSTQAGVCNVYGAKAAKEYGFDRVILARETLIEDIKRIAEIIETEVFVQGALCTCFSGQCYFSSFAGGNSGNRGKCKQPCRKKYSIDRAGFEDYAYRLSLSDLCVGEDIKKLEDAGVASFKIEGRMRRPEYVAAAVTFYRKALESKVSQTDLTNLKRTYNRGNYTKGLAYGQDKSLISSSVQGHIGEYVGSVTVENGKFVCRSNRQFVKGDSFKILRDGKEVCGAVFSRTEKNGFEIAANLRLKNGDKIFITTDTALNKKLLSKQRLIDIKLSAIFLSGKRAKIYINDKLFKGEKVLDKANNLPLTEEDIKNAFKKVDKYPFAVDFKEILTDGVFIPKAELNELRRNAFKEYFESISISKKKILSAPSLDFPKSNGKNKKVAVICTDLNGLSADIGILKLDNFSIAPERLINEFKGEKYLFLPPYLTGEEIEHIKKLSVVFEGIYCDGIYGVKLAEELNKPLFAGLGFNISNSLDAQLCHAKYYAISKEITITEADGISDGRAFYLSAGDIKVMDLIYCPFEKKCKSCDKRNLYALCDEAGRKFQIRRYKTSDCRFEIFNCAPLVAAAETHKAGALLDCTLQTDPEFLIKNRKKEKALCDYFKNYTRGHSKQSVY